MSFFCEIGLCLLCHTQSWMNEISNYDPETYHATLTHSVFVRLEGSIIRLSKPNHNISRRSTHNEPKPEVNYISQKIYDLTNSKVCCPYEFKEMSCCRLIDKQLRRSYLLVNWQNMCIYKAVS